MSFLKERRIKRERRKRERERFPCVASLFFNSSVILNCLPTEFELWKKKQARDKQEKSDFLQIVLF